jgi:hypothetical protein
MNIEYFGWLTKGKCQISFLDILILFSEIGLIALIVIIAYVILNKAKAKVRK